MAELVSGRGVRCGDLGLFNPAGGGAGIDVDRTGVGSGCRVVVPERTDDGQVAIDGHLDPVLVAGGGIGSLQLLGFGPDTIDQVEHVDRACVDHRGAVIVGPGSEQQGVVCHGDRSPQPILGRRV